MTTFGSKQSGEAAYAMSGLGPSDINFAQLYDCFTIVPIIEMEELALAERGEGGELFLKGEIRNHQAACR